MNNSLLPNLLSCLLTPKVTSTAVTNSHQKSVVAPEVVIPPGHVLGAAVRKCKKALRHPEVAGGDMIATVVQKAVRVITLQHAWSASRHLKERLEQDLKPSTAENRVQWLFQLQPNQQQGFACPGQNQRVARAEHQRGDTPRVADAARWSAGRRALGHAAGDLPRRILGMTLSAAAPIFFIKWASIRVQGNCKGALACPSGPPLLTYLTYLGRRRTQIGTYKERACDVQQSPLAQPRHAPRAAFAPPAPRSTTTDAGSALDP